MVRRVRPRGTKEEEILELRADVLHLHREREALQMQVALERKHSARLKEKLEKAEKLAVDLYGDRLKNAMATKVAEKTATQVAEEMHTRSRSLIPGRPPYYAEAHTYNDPYSAAYNGAALSRIMRDDFSELERRILDTPSILPKLKGET